jgi:hypothetical protein
MLSEHEKVTSVLHAYRSILVDTKRSSEFIQVKKPEIDSKYYDTCVQFYDSAEEFGVSVPSLMMTCLDNYSPWWCMKTLKRNYPTIHLAISEKTRNQALKNFPRKAESNKPDQVAEFYAQQLKGYGEAIATGLILNGMCGDDTFVKGLVLNKLREARMK